MSALPSALHADNIPQELKDLPQWVCWRYATRDGKRTKVPVNPKTGQPASSTDPATWASFSDAVTALDWSHHDGIGFVFSESDPYFFIDLDDARDIDTNQEWAADIVSRFSDAYWEVSPSGLGVHGIGRGVLPPNGNRKGQIELYDHARFATITGEVIEYGDLSADCTAILAEFHAELFAPVIAVASPVQPHAPTPPLTDDEVLNRALGAKNGEKLRALLSGDTTGYGSQSEADLAAVGCLRFWTQDAAQIERILRLSGLQRDKWDHNKTYIERTITNALAQPHERYEPPSNVVDFRKHLSGGSATDGSLPPSTDDVVPGFRLSDLGNGQRLAARIQGKARYCHPAKRWYVNDGTRWAQDDRGLVQQAAKQSVLTMYDAVSSLPDKERAALLKHAHASESDRALKAAISQASSEPEITVLPDEFDRDPMLFNVQNGTIDLRTGELRPHDPQDMISALSPVVYDPEATCPRWIAFLEQIFEQNTTLIRYIQKALGYTLTGLTIERAVFCLWGVGKNGKSTLLKVVAQILGEYARKTPTETLMLKRGDSGPSNDVAILKGARLVTASETEESRKLNVAKVKDMSGDEELAARFLYGETFNFRPQFKLWISTNHKPIIPGNDRAMFDRFKLIPFTFRVEPEHVNKRLESELLAEAPGILNWLLEGCLAWQTEGLQDPETVTDAVMSYQQEMDQVAAFIADRCIVGPGYRAASGDLYTAYKAWCEANGERQNTSTWLGRQLTEREFTKVLDGPKRVRTWVGIGLLDNNSKNERVQPAQSANSGKSRLEFSHEGNFTENALQPAHPLKPAQNANQATNPSIVPDDEGWV